MSLLLLPQTHRKQMSVSRGNDPVAREGLQEPCYLFVGPDEQRLHEFVVKVLALQYCQKVRTWGGERREEFRERSELSGAI